MLAVKNLLKTADGLGNRHIHAAHSRKLLRHMERLGKESLYSSRTCHHQLIFLGKFVHTEYGDDILQFLVLLQEDSSGSTAG